MKAVDISDIVEIIVNVTGGSVSGRIIDKNTQLLGAMPEMDSMAIINVILALESRFGFHIDDEEVEQAVFESVGSLHRFVECKLSKLDYQQTTASQG